MRFSVNMCGSSICFVVIATVTIILCLTKVEAVALYFNGATMVEYFDSYSYSYTAGVNWYAHNPPCSYRRDEIGSGTAIIYEVGGNYYVTDSSTGSCRLSGDECSSVEWDCVRYPNPSFSRTDEDLGWVNGDYTVSDWAIGFSCGTHSTSYSGQYRMSGSSYTSNRSETDNSKITFRISCNSSTQIPTHINISNGYFDGTSTQALAFQLNGVTPVVTPRDYGTVSLSWRIPINVACGGTITVVPTCGSDSLFAYLDGASVEYAAATCVDSDHDGHSAINPGCPLGDDCNDNDPSIHPGATELCDGKDNNCNGQIDEALFQDKDGDGYSVQIAGCPVPGDYDCNDNDATIYPSAPEMCGDFKDNNCNSVIDESCKRDRCMEISM